MIMPGRTLNSDSYRYSINGQEKTPEIAPNTTTAEFWQYDARIVRRWNIDPKPNVSISPYNCFAGNPIWLTDVKGDTLDIPANYSQNARAASAVDIFSVLKNQNNKQFFQFDDNGRVTIDNSKLKDPLDRGRAMSDKGFELLYNLINSKYSFYYSASPGTQQVEVDMLTGKKTGPVSVSLTLTYKSGSIIDGPATTKYHKYGSVSHGVNDINLAISNLSSTLKGTEANEGNKQLCQANIFLIAINDFMMAKSRLQEENFIICQEL